MSKQPSLTLVNHLQFQGGQSNLQTLLRDVVAPFDGENRRAETRLKKSLVLIVQPLNNSFEPIGSAFKAVTRDVSETGLGFLHANPFPTSFVRIGATAHSAVQSIAQVCYNRANFGDELVYFVGVKFITQ